MNIRDVRQKCLESAQAGLEELQAVSSIRDEYERFVLEFANEHSNDEFLIFPDEIVSDAKLDELAAAAATANSTACAGAPANPTGEEVAAQELALA